MSEQVSIGPAGVLATACRLLEPIFEADLQPEQYAYRPDRSALDAVRQIHMYASPPA